MIVAGWLIVAFTAGFIVGAGALWMLLIWQMRD